MLQTHWDEMKPIYKEGIATGSATFETEAPNWDIWDRNHLENCRLIAFVKNNVVGWAALCAVSGRKVYAGVTEVSIYVAKAEQGKGIGRRLLQELIRESEQAGIWTLQAGIFAENSGSIALHKSCGFREVGLREKIGKFNSTWKDIMLMERRSKIAGV